LPLRLYLCGFAALRFNTLRAELLGDFLHQLAELPGRVEISDGHVLEDLFAGEFLHVGSIDIADLCRPQQRPWSIDDLFDFAIERQIGEDFAESIRRIDFST
jgi:hypothetical protein